MTTRSARTCRASCLTFVSGWVLSELEAELLADGHLIVCARLEAPAEVTFEETCRLVTSAEEHLNDPWRLVAVPADRIP